MIRYYFLVATQDFLLYQEPIEEIFRERIKHYKALKKDIDFALTTNLVFLNVPDLIEINSKLTKPAAAIISLNPKFIDWLKLRMHYAIKGTFVSSKIKLKNDLIDEEKS